MTALCQDVISDLSSADELILPLETSDQIAVTIVSKLNKPFWMVIFMMRDQFYEKDKPMSLIVVQYCTVSKEVQSFSSKVKKLAR